MAAVARACNLRIRKIRPKNHIPPYPPARNLGGRPPVNFEHGAGEAPTIMVLFVP